MVSMTSIDLLLRALDLTDAAERRSAEAELIRLGKTGMEAVTAALPAATLRQQVAMIKLLGKMQNLEVLPTLRGALTDPQWLIRQAAVNAMSHLPAERVLPLIYHALYDPALLVRLEAIAALGKLAHPSAVPTLLAHLHGTTSEVECYTLIESIGMCGDRTVISTLEPYVHHDSAQVRQRALDAIARLSRTR